MKILLVDVNCDYINPTSELFRCSLQMFSDLEYFGPGYVTSDILKKGLLNFLGTNTYDLIVFGNQVSVLSKPDNIHTPAYYSKYTYYKTNFSDIFFFLNDVYENVMNIHTPKVASLLAVDYYAMKKEPIERLEQGNFYVIGYGKEFTFKKDDIPDYFYKEKHFLKKKEQTDIGVNWYQYVSKQSHKMISMVHFLNYNEFDYGILQDRKYTSYVPGVEYILRQQAKSKLKAEKINMAPKWHNKIYSLLNKLGFNTYSTFIGMKNYQLFYRYNLINSKFSYASDGGFGMPLRKYFEIPASGSLMMATPCLGMKELGFIDKIHYVSSSPEELVSKIQYYNNNLDEAQKIVKNAQKLIWDKHSIYGRAIQLKNSFESILKNDFDGSYWENGNFVIKTKKELK